MRSWLLLLFLCGTFASVAYLALMAGAEAGKGLPEYSVYSNESNGLATTGRVLRQLGFEPVALTRPIQQTHHRGLLILVEPGQPDPFGRQTPGLSQTDAKGLLEWVDKGNTLVLIGKHETRLHEALGVASRHDDKAEDVVQTVEAVEVGGYTEPGSARDTVRVQQLGVEGRDTVHTRQGVPLWLGSNGPGALVMPHGEGRVLVIADPSLWTHRGLLRADNVLFLYNVAALDADGRRVYFDEYHHGIRSGSGYWDYLRYHDQHWNVLQLLAVVGVAVWGAAVRLGPPVARPKPPRADVVDYASAAARIYQRAGVRDLLAQHAVRDFLAALATHLRLRRSAVPAQILAEWRHKHGKESAERLAELLRGAVELRRAAAGASAEIPEQELLRWSRAFDQFRRDERLEIRD